MNDRTTRGISPESFGLIINGEERAATTGDVFRQLSPSSGEVSSIVANGGLVEADLAVQSAHAAFQDGRWRCLSDVERRDILLRFAALVAGVKAELGEIQTRETGKPLSQSLGEVDSFVDFTQYAAGAIQHITGEVVSNSAVDGLGMVIREPIGVVAAITPYNAPLWTLAPKLAFALAAGCTLVIKPSPMTSGLTVTVARLLREAGVPDGVCNILTSDRVEVSQALVEHPLVDKVVFTGSETVGISIARSAALTMKRVTLELGGKSPNIICGDGDLDAFGAQLGSSIFPNSGQICTAGSLVLAERAVHAEVVDRLVAASKSEIVGDPFDLGTTMGPLISSRHRSQVSSMVESAVAEGAHVVAGGSVPVDLPGNCYYEPTVLCVDDPSSSIVSNEVFGPVVTVLPFDRDDEVVRLVNSSRYGLKAALWTRDSGRLLRFMRDLRVGSVMGNTWNRSISQSRMPFGGFGMSGVGRELGMEGLVETYTESKSVFLKF